MIDPTFLSSINIFSPLTSTELDVLAKNFTLLNKQENDIIFRKGDTDHSFFIIQDGTIKITTKGIDGEEIILAILHKGDYFGELAMLDQTSRSANAIVFDHATLLQISRSKFITIMKSHPDIAISMLTVLGKRLRATNEIMEKQITRNVNDEMENELTFAERTADKFAEVIGSWNFIFGFTFTMIAWISLNVYAVFFKAVDPYPFILLNLMLSCLAAIQAPVIMMSQGRQAKKDKLAADMDYKINLKAELQIQDIRSHIEKINKQQTKLNKEIRHEQAEILKTQQLILAKLEKPV